MNQLYFTSSAEWRAWLRNNHHTGQTVWVVFYRKHTGTPSIEYESAVEEALCYGWIDSIIKKIDERKYCQKFTPRNENSVWSERNKERVARLIQAGRMTDAGMAKIEAAKRNGQWDKPARPEIRTELVEEFQTALKRSALAQETFRNLAPSYQKQYLGWIAAAKRRETREKRIREAVGLLESGRKLGMK